MATRGWIQMYSMSNSTSNARLQFKIKHVNILIAKISFHCSQFLLNWQFSAAMFVMVVPFGKLFNKTLAKSNFYAAVQEVWVRLGNRSTGLTGMHAGVRSKLSCSIMRFKPF